MNIETILLPIDFESVPSSLIHQAAIVARHFRSRIVLLNVLTPLSYSAAPLEGNYVPTSREDLLSELIRQAQRNLDHCLQPEFEGLPVKRLLAQGDPAHEIVKASRDENADLIMMPTHGRKGFRRFLLGSVTAKILHDCESPVWTGAHLEESSPPQFALRSIACAVDLKESDHSTAAWAAQLAASFQARLTLVHIVPAALDTYDASSEWKIAMTSLANRQLSAMRAAIGAEADLVVESGDPGRMLDQIAAERKADLLVVGRRPSSGHVGGTGYAIIRESQIPVISVRRPATR